MQYLLDTHAFLWFINGDTQLSDNARALIESPFNERFVSIASFWEMAIKYRAFSQRFHVSKNQTAAVTAGQGDSGV